MMTGPPRDQKLDGIQRDIDLCVEMLQASYFKEEPMKAYAWLLIKNPHFGNISPIILIIVGRSKKVISFIENAGKDNQP